MTWPAGAYQGKRTGLFLSTVRIDLHNTISPYLLYESSLFILSLNVVWLRALRVAVHLYWRLIQLHLRITVLGVEIILCVFVFKDALVNRCD